MEQFPWGKVVVRGRNSPATSSLTQVKIECMIRNGPRRFVSHADATVTRFAEGITDKTSVMRLVLHCVSRIIGTTVYTPTSGAPNKWGASDAGGVNLHGSIRDISSECIVVFHPTHACLIRSSSAFDECLGSSTTEVVRTISPQRADAKTIESCRQ